MPVLSGITRSIRITSGRKSTACSMACCHPRGVYQPNGRSRSANRLYSLSSATNTVRRSPTANNATIRRGSFLLRDGRHRQRHVKPENAARSSLTPSIKREGRTRTTHLQLPPMICTICRLMANPNPAPSAPPINRMHLFKGLKNP